MIDYKEMTLSIGHRKGTIINFEVWWMTPFGMFPNIAVAKEKLEEHNLPYDILRPLCVAICDNGVYEPLV